MAASIWLEKGYDNRPYFIGFALFCLSATFFTVADLRYVLVQYSEWFVLISQSIFFLRLIPASAAYIHRLFMDTVARYVELAYIPPIAMRLPVALYSTAFHYISSNDAASIFRQ